MSGASKIETTIVTRNGRKYVRALIEVEIDYPVDMPRRIALEYADHPITQITNYASSIALKEEAQHR
jgi:hypothetical protein